MELAGYGSIGMPPARPAWETLGTWAVPSILVSPRTTYVSDDDIRHAPTLIP